MSDIKTIKALFFDVGGVLLRAGRTQNLIAELETGPEDPDDAIASVLWGAAWEKYQVGQCTDEEYHRAVAEALDMEYPGEVTDFIRWFYDGEFLDEDVVALAKRLRRRYKVGIVSNAGEFRRRQLHERFGMDAGEIFDDLVVSYEIGVAKPDLEFYRVVCERLGATPEEAVFIDDSAPHVKAAMRLGMHGIVFEDCTTLVKDLEALLGPLP
ncbi:MAG: HAD family phosphatase [Anaerolineae bacterium]|nr:HAD family phosphatase [Anaerolineae bacterium]